MIISMLKDVGLTAMPLKGDDDDEVAIRGMFCVRSSIVEHPPGLACGKTFPLQMGNPQINFHLKYHVIAYHGRITSYLCALR